MLSKGAYVCVASTLSDNGLRRNDCQFDGMHRRRTRELSAELTAMRASLLC